MLYTANASRVKLVGLLEPVKLMLWKLALYLLLAWGIVCTVLTVTFFARVGFNELRRWLSEAGRARTTLIPAEQSRVITMRPSPRRPG